MIDFSKVKYRLVLTDGKNKYNITEYVEGLGWEENEKELAIRTTFSVKNDKTAKGYLSSLIQPGHVIFVYATKTLPEGMCLNVLVMICYTGCKKARTTNSTRPERGLRQ